jgi:Flp pilus assembly protein CpaB
MPRRSPRVVLLWLGAGALAVVTALIVAGDLASLHRRAGSLGAPQQVAVATGDLAVGAVVESADVRARSVHRSQLPDGVVTPSDARDRVVAIAIAQGAYVLERNLAPRRRTGLDGAIPRGMRALRIVARDSLRPRPGNAVDVLVTFDGAVDGTAATERRPGGADVVARGVLVLGTDDDPATLDAGSTGAADGLGVTLLVTRHEAEALAAASATGTVALALVPPEDAAPTP